MTIRIISILSVVLLYIFNSGFTKVVTENNINKGKLKSTITTDKLLNKKVKKIIKYIILIIVIYILITFFFIRTISGVSMEPTIKDGDKILLLPPMNIERFDIVRINSHNFGGLNRHFYIKRVIAFENETIEIINGDLLINGKLVKQKFRTLNKNVFDIEKTVVPKGSVYVLGDNRVKSLDSDELGCFRTKDIWGKLIFRINK